VAGTSLLHSSRPAVQTSLCALPASAQEKGANQNPGDRAERSASRRWFCLLGKFSVANSSVPRVGCFLLADSNGGGGELRIFWGFLDLLIPSVVFVL